MRLVSLLCSLCSLFPRYCDTDHHDWQGGVFDTSMWDNCPARCQVSLRHTATTPRSQDWALSHSVAHQSSWLPGHYSAISTLQSLSPAGAPLRRISLCRPAGDSFVSFLLFYGTVLFFFVEESFECLVTFVGAVGKTEDPCIFLLMSVLPPNPPFPRTRFRNEPYEYLY